MKLRLSVVCILAVMVLGFLPNSDTTTASPQKQGSTLIFSVHHEDVEGAIISADGNRVLSWSFVEGTVRIWDIELGEQLFSIEHGGVGEATWNADESQFMTWGWNIYLKVWGAETGEELLALEHDNKIAGAKWNADESRILSWSHRGTVYIWDISTSEALLQIPHDGFVGGAGWNRDETQLMTWTTWDDTSAIYVWDAVTGEQLHRLPHEAAISAEWNVDESQILTWGWDHMARVWNAETGDLLFEIEQVGLGGAEWNPDESQILTWAYDGARTWDARTGEPLLMTEHTDDDENVGGARWSPDGSQILTWAELSGTVTICDAMSGDRLLELTNEDGQPPNDSYIWFAEWNNDGSLVMEFPLNNAAVIWDVRNGTVLARLVHDDQVRGAIWSESEARVLTWSPDGAIKVWEIG